MKNYKKLVPLVLVVLMVLSIYSLYSSATKLEEQYNTILEKARSKASVGVLVDAIDLYNQALEINDDFDLYVEIGQMYADKGTMKSRITWGNYMIERFPTTPESYEYLMQAYYDNESYKSCFAVYETCVKRSSVSEKVAEIYSAIKYSYEIDNRKYQDVRVYSGGYCAFLQDGKWGYVDERGKVILKPQYLRAGDFLDVAAIMTAEKEIYYIDADGNRKVVANENVTPVWLGLYDGEVYSVYDGTSYFYYNAANERISGPYEYASVYNYDVAAVVRDGKWQFVNMMGELAIEDIFEEVVLDEREIAFRNERAFVAERGSTVYKMIDLSGNQIGNVYYEDARAFLDMTYAAVKQSGKWGFVDKDGNWAQEPQYEEAVSFCNGYAAVRQNGKWGFINMDFNMVIKPEYEDVKPFNAKGGTFVKQNGAWQFISMLKDNF